MGIRESIKKLFCGCEEKCTCQEKKEEKSSSDGSEIFEINGISISKDDLDRRANW